MKKKELFFGLGLLLVTCNLCLNGMEKIDKKLSRKNNK